MNRANRQRLFAAVIGAVLGAGLGRSIEPLAQDPAGRERFRSLPYQRLYRAYPRVGAGIGALVGAGFATIAQAQRRRLRRRTPRSGGPSAGSPP
ncbi:hypothetical protein KBY96_11245 [Cyanobium sp. ATX 6A2]|uniref:hypothetical protein n=1 Tax=Cyanobium sp. ATX 6A2 TaxID=2823700 RepID=UPI0020CED079|nr:hypothetical protein [Cyanobium sp. ATX 6A2]MCP9888500.1 hypothetical protein [Cyanobium sp. ATX 6A2]